MALPKNQNSAMSDLLPFPPSGPAADALLLQFWTEARSAPHGIRIPTNAPGPLQARLYAIKKEVAGIHDFSSLVLVQQPDSLLIIPSRQSQFRPKPEISLEDLGLR